MWVNEGMTRYADPERCPDCLRAMPFGTTRCPACGLPLEGPVAAELFATLSHADDLLTSLRTPTAATAGATPPAATPAPDPTATGSAAETAAAGVATLTRPPRLARRAGHGVSPPREPHPGTGVAGASVPRILLGLGALCLLVAALVFLAVTWSAMGVAGRTATLVGFTAVAGGLTAWAARRNLRAAAESLGVVALGLLAFDLFGARDAGWLGDVTTPGFAVVLGSVLALAGVAAATAVRRTPASALVGAEVVAGLGVAVAAAGAVTADWLAWSTALTLCVVVTAGVAVAARALRLGVLTVATGLVALVSWMLLLFSAWDRALQHPSARELWLGLEGWPLVAAALLVGALGLVVRLPSAVRVTSLGVAAVVVATALLAPFADEPLTQRTVAGAVLLVGVAAVTLALPQPWRRSLALPGVLGLVWMLAVAGSLGAQATLRIVEAGGDLWSGGAGDAFTAGGAADWQPASWLLPVVVLAAAASLFAVARSFSWADRGIAPLAELDVVLAVVAATAAATLALHEVPVWSVLVVLLATGGGLVVATLRRQEALPLGLAAAFLGLAVLLSLHAQWLTLVALLVALAAAASLHLRARWLTVGVAAGVLLAAAVAALVWTVGAVADAPVEWVALVALLALGVLTLAGPYVDDRWRVTGPATLARLGTEVGALAAAAVVSVAGVDLATGSSEATWTAVYLTLVGAAASAMGLLRPDRRRAGWLGGFLLAAASWVRLADLGVEAPEAYTLPSAAALVAVGLVHLRRAPGSGTLAALSPGLGLALVPSLLWVYEDPIALRSVLLGAACLGLVVGGVRLRWSAPVVHGALAGALLVLRHASPIAAEAVPRWALIGAAGALLIAMGITWEQRVRDARRVAGYARGLR